MRIRDQRRLFLDRDGVLINAVSGTNRGPRSLSELVFSSGLVELVEAAIRFRLQCVVVTNQPDLERGLYKMEDELELEEAILEQLPGGSMYFRCPHSSLAKCHCRKPAAGLLEMANRSHYVPPQHSVLIGDRCTDIEAGRRFGCHANILISRDQEEFSCEPDVVVRSLRSAVRALPRFFAA